MSTTETPYVSDEGRVIWSGGAPRESIVVQGVTYTRTEGGVCGTCNYSIARVNGELRHEDPSAPRDHVAGYLP